MTRVGAARTVTVSPRWLACAPTAARAARARPLRSIGSASSRPTPACASLRASTSRASTSRSARALASRTTSPIRRRSVIVACGSARVTSTSVRITDSGVRSSWLALATNRRWLSNADASRASIASNVSASSLSSSSGPSRAIRWSSVSVDSRRAVAVTSLTGCSARPARM